MGKISNVVLPNGNAYDVRATAIPYGEVDSTSTSTAFTVTVPGITELTNGTLCYIRNNVVTSASGFTIDVNGLGAKPVYSSLAAASRSTTIFNINYTMMFIYNENRVSDGCWDVFYGYDSNTNTIGYQIRTYGLSLPMSSVVYRYRLLFTSADGTHFVPANNATSTNATAARTTIQEKIDPFGRIIYYGTTASVAAGSRPAAGSLWQQYAPITLGYSFNRTGAALVLTLWKPLYLKCAPQTDGSAIIDADTPYVQTLPSTEDGKIYIFLGIVYTETQFELTLEHPIYEYKDGAIRQWTNGKTSYDDLLNKPTIPDAVTWTQKTNSGVNIAEITIGSTTTQVYAPTGGGSSISPYTSNPAMDGTASAGSSNDYARGDHVHPSDTSRVPTTRKVNGKALSSDITLTASDVSALPSSTSIPSKTSDLTNDSGFIAGITSTDITNALGYTPASAVIEETISSSGAATQALDAGKVYHFSSDSLTSLTITLNAANEIAQYHFDFISPATAVTLVLPNSVVMPAGFSVDANKRYEIDILNNYGVYQSWSYGV